AQPVSVLRTITTPQERVSGSWLIWASGAAQHVGGRRVDGSARGDIAAQADEQNAASEPADPQHGIEAVAQAEQLVGNNGCEYRRTYRSQQPGGKAQRGKLRQDAGQYSPPPHPERTQHRALET